MFIKTSVLSFFLILSFSLYAVVPHEAYSFDIQLIFTEYQKESWDKFDEATFLLKQVIQTNEFKKEILSHKFQGRRRFHFNSGMSNLKIYQKILDGAESLNKIKNNTLDAEIDFFRKYDSNVIGFTKKNTNKIWVNEKYLNKFTPAELAGHLMHEWLHKLGFGHEVEKTSNRKYSVPYSIGRIVKKMSTEIMNSSSFSGL